MRKHSIWIIIVIVLFVLTVSCNEETINEQLELNEGPLITSKPLLSPAASNPVLSLENYNPDEMLITPYQEALPKGVEVIYNDEQFTILKYLSGSKSSTHSACKVDIQSGIHDGKMIYKDFIGYYRSGSSYIADYKYGFMNWDFSRLTEAKYDRVFPFENGKAIVKTADGFGVINTEGSIIIPCELNIKPEFYGNFIKVPLKKTEDTTIYLCYDGFSGDYVYTLKKTYDKILSKNKFFKTNLDGTEEEIFDVEGIESIGLQKFKDAVTRMWGYKNEFGQIIVEPQFGYASEFIEGYAKVWINGKYGFIDESGDIAIPCIYDNADDFDNGNSKVVYNGKSLFIDYDGEKVEDYHFTAINKYSDDLAAAVLYGEENWQYVNENFELAFNGYYSKAGEFSHSLAPVMSVDLVIYGKGDSLGKNYYYIDTKGVPVFGQLIFQEAYKLNEEGYGLAWSMGSEEKFDVNTGNIYSITAYEYYVIISRK